MTKAENLVINSLISRVRRLETTVVRIKRQLPQHENQIDLIAASIMDLHEKLSVVDQKLDQKVDKTLFNHRLNTVEAKLDLILDALAMKK